MTSFSQLKCWISWSTGKDSSFALMQTLSNPQIEVCGLLSTVTKELDRVSMHATRKVLLEMQSKSLGIPLYVVEIPQECTRETYENQMQCVMNRAKEDKIHSIIFGDLFLEDIRVYRESKLRQTGIIPSFPLWNYNTSNLAKDLINSGIKAVVSCVDIKKLSSEFVGREYDHSFLNDLPDGVDPCGENGEFHTFVYDAPIFSFPIKFFLGEIFEQQGICFVDLVPIDTN